MSPDDTTCDIAYDDGVDELDVELFDVRKAAAEEVAAPAAPEAAPVSRKRKAKVKAKAKKTGRPASKNKKGTMAANKLKRIADAREAEGSPGIVLFRKRAVGTRASSRNANKRAK